MGWVGCRQNDFEQFGMRRTVSRFGWARRIGRKLIKFDGQVEGVLLVHEHGTFLASLQVD